MATHALVAVAVAVLLAVCAAPGALAQTVQDERRTGLLADMLHEVRGGALLHAAQHNEGRRGAGAGGVVLLDVVVATCSGFLLVLKR
uniref:Uncharacterized protein n=1 Tax=Aegilops tauschii TaxID=37682 RepID=M8BIP7_AEGTA